MIGPIVLIYVFVLRRIVWRGVVPGVLGVVPLPAAGREGWILGGVSEEVCGRAGAGQRAEVGVGGTREPPGVGTVQVL